MIIKRKFVWGTSREHGTSGWIPASMPDFDPVLEGYGMAHDILEHFSATDASIEAEFMAFGSIIYFRAEPNYWGMVGAYLTDPAEILSSDVARFLQDQLHRDTPVRWTKVAARLCDDTEDMLARMVKAVLREKRSCEFDREQSVRYNADLREALNWMRIGYHAAVKRWGIEDQIYRLDLFYTVERACDDILKNDDAEHFDGDILTITVDSELPSIEHTMRNLSDYEYN